MKYDKQNTASGNAHKINDRFVPITFVSSPNTKHPKNAPTEKSDPIHPATAVVIFPSSSGVTSDCRIGSAGEYHPILTPTPNTTKLPIGNYIM